MDIKKLVTFINLVETRNYTRTAKMMHVTQPTVTHDINAIENEVGVKMFNRNKRYVNVTQDGQQFYQKIRPLINSYYSAVQDIQKRSLQEKTLITLGYSYSLFNDFYLPVWIKQFQKSHPEVKFALENLTHNDLKQHFLTDELDVVITTGEEALDLSNVKSYLIEKESFMAIVPKDNPLSERFVLQLNDFQGQQMLFLDGNWAAVDLINLQNKIIHLNDEINVTYAEDLPTLNILLKSGQGITVGLYCIYAELDDSLTYVPLNCEQTVDFIILTHKNNDKRIVHQFIKFIQKNI
ncbi:LysR family transcriptional regulator [uncultured Lactobacillus sp.]|uniref:LysR family transcriptional regulator n=1 Tax=uncultured Lactobacillus sp. TaxID=153152 RepID=UPI0025FE0F9F|nr:LysR family transcriptional regulator [uncultured Lactobacillus sp.]